MNLRKIFHKIAILRPLLKLLGIKDGTVVGKVEEGVEVVDKVLSEDEKNNPAKSLKT